MATELGQTSVLLSETIPNILTVNNDPDIIGQWHFSVTSCELLTPDIHCSDKLEFIIELAEDHNTQPYFVDWVDHIEFPENSGEQII